MLGKLTFKYRSRQQMKVINKKYPFFHTFIKTIQIKVTLDKVLWVSALYRNSS